MKKIKYLIAFLMFLFINGLSADASSCTYSEQAALRNGAANIKVKYEEAKGVVDPDLYICNQDHCYEEYEYFLISVLNLTEDFYIQVTNNVTDDKKTIRYSDVKNGVAQFKWEHLYDVTTFTFDVYSSNETNCPRDHYRKIYFTTPRLNEYYNMSVCEENPDYYLCQKYVTFDEMSFYDFYDKIDEYKEELKTGSQTEKPTGALTAIISFFLTHKTMFIIGGSAILVIGVVIAIYRKNRKKSVL